MKRKISLILASLLILSCLSSCGSEKINESSEEESFTEISVPGHSEEETSEDISVTDTELSSEEEESSEEESSEEESSEEESSEEESSEEESSEEESSEEESSEEESYEEESSEEESSEEESSEETSTDDDKAAKKEKPAEIKKEEGKKYVAFTFDDGPSIRTMGLLDFIEENDMKVTFFVVGNRLDGKGDAGKYAAEVKRASSLGCEIGIHAYTHEYYWSSCSDDIYTSELQKTETLIYENAGYYPIIMRPPGGSITQQRADESEYNIIIWNVDSEDWKNSSRADDATIEKNINTIVNNIMDNVKDGSIVLMHDLYVNSVEAFKIASLRLKEMGYEFVTVGELAGLDGETTIGKRYYSEYLIK